MCYLYFHIKRNVTISKVLILELEEVNFISLLFCIGNFINNYFAKAQKSRFKQRSTKACNRKY